MRTKREFAGQIRERQCTAQVCPRFNMFTLLLTCDFMAQLLNVAFDKPALYTEGL